MKLESLKTVYVCHALASDRLGLDSAVGSGKSTASMAWKKCDMSHSVGSRTWNGMEEENGERMRPSATNRAG